MQVWTYIIFGVERPLENEKKLKNHVTGFPIKEYMLLIADIVFEG